MYIYLLILIAIFFAYRMYITKQEKFKNEKECIENGINLGILDYIFGRNNALRPS
jgi:4-hydroxybenzoate polyprenyltransferase